MEINEQIFGDLAPPHVLPRLSSNVYAPRFLPGFEPVFYLIEALLLRFHRQPLANLLGQPCLHPQGLVTRRKN